MDECCFFKVKSVTIVYNGSATHVIPFAANLLLNSVFRLITSTDETFQVSTHPFSTSPKRNDDDYVPALGVLDFLFLALFVGMSLSLIPGIYGKHLLLLVYSIIQKYV